jgi:hypothetical protein
MEYENSIEHMCCGFFVDPVGPYFVIVPFFECSDIIIDAAIDTIGLRTRIFLLVFFT